MSEKESGQFDGVLTEYDLQVIAEIWRHDESALDQPHERRRRVIEQLAVAVGATGWAIWLCQLSPGQDLSLERMAGDGIVASTHDALVARLGALIVQYGAPDRWQQRMVFCRDALSTMDDCLGVMYRLDGRLSIIVYIRESGAGRFSDRDLRIVQLVLREQEWVHCELMDMSIPDDSQQLNDRHLNVLSYLLCGYTRQEIAETMCLSHHTINGYFKNIYRYYNVHSREELFWVFLHGTDRDIT